MLFHIVAGVLDANTCRAKYKLFSYPKNLYLYVTKYIFEIFIVSNVPYFNK